MHLPDRHTQTPARIQWSGREVLTYTPRLHIQVAMGDPPCQPKFSGATTLQAALGSLDKRFLLVCHLRPSCHCRLSWRYYLLNNHPCLLEVSGQLCLTYLSQNPQKTQQQSVDGSMKDSRCSPLPPSRHAPIRAFANAYCRKNPLC